MREITCVEIYRKKNDVPYLYKLKITTNKNVYDILIVYSELKKMMKDKTIKIDNLVLNKNDKIVTKKGSLRIESIYK